jgi:DNA polymerase III epsilon subunit-like protein
MRYFVGDTETTGLRGARACDIALIEIDPVTLEVIDTFSSLIDPETPIPPGASAIHGIFDADVYHAPTMEEFVTQVLPGGRIDEPCVLVGHNVKFDKPFFEPVMNVQKTMCTLMMARQAYPTGPINHKLASVAKFLGIEQGEAHRALGDCLTVLGILRKVLPEIGKTVVDYVDVPRRLVHVMPFGEHTGKMLMDVPQQYRTWLLTRDIDEDLRYSLMQLRAAGV